MLKRGFDILASTLGLIVLSPLFLIIAILVRLISPGPIIYRATRVGKDGQHFTLLKFRTMVINADKHGPGVTKNNDHRITRIGRVLRRGKLDELPQLVNVLRGEMSLVGPRPEDPRYVAMYSPEQRKVLTIRPGITSVASLTYHNEESLLDGDDWETRYIRVVMPAKLAIDMDYAQNATLLRDISLIIRTILCIVQNGLRLTRQKLANRWRLRFG